MGRMVRFQQHLYQKTAAEASTVLASGQYENGVDDSHVLADPTSDRTDLWTANVHVVDKLQ